MQRPVLCLVTDRRSARRPLEEIVAAAVEGGVDWVQIRERDLEGGALLALCDRVGAAARAAAARRGGAVRVLINRRVDVALACGADGAHLGFDALPVRAARALLAAPASIGVSAHAPDELRAAARDGADYAHLAPIFAPLSKPAERPPLGLEALRAPADGLPVLAQGGVEPSNAGAILRAGAAGVAVTGAIQDSSDPHAAARSLRRALDGAFA
ncbi:MAG: thiamine phosphate synthase [Proteobacteria bacterium]|nr:MAG: thiamine phosphate synthase [Pseudomonadota bacterium]